MNAIILPFAQLTSPDLRPDTSAKVVSKETFYLRKDQSRVLDDICNGIERANLDSMGKIDKSMLGRALVEIAIDMAFGINPVNARETPQAALLRKIQDEALIKKS